MILKANRFHGYGSLKHVYQRGTTARGSFFAVKALPSRRSSYRAAIVISRKVSKSAVKRNRMRRRLYAIIRELSDQIKPYDIVISVFNEQALTEPYESLAKQVQKQLAGVGALEPPAKP